MSDAAECRLARRPDVLDAAALLWIIDAIRARGYSFVTMSALTG
jgi:hypothetical protein